MEENDGHRSAPEKDHGHPPEVSGPGAGAFPPLTFQGVPITFTYTSGHTVYYASGAGPLVPLPPSPITEPLPDGGIVVGEITGWRVWRIISGDHPMRLQSVSMTDVWDPETPMHGDPDCCHKDAYGISCEGVHAFKTYDDMMRQFNVALAWREKWGPKFMYGEVSLWGTVIEHERGYRAEYAKPKSLYKCAAVPEETYRQMCAVYGIEPGVDADVDPWQVQSHRRDNADLALTLGMGVLTVFAMSIFATYVGHDNVSAFFMSVAAAAGAVLTAALARKWWQGD